MKVAVYSICKNEAQNVELYMASAKEADCVCVLDTGSKDNTLALLRKHEGDQVRIRQMLLDPWRFDTARNAALDMVPQDVDLCVICDMDERFPPGWRKKLEEIWPAGCTRMQIRYVFAWKADGSPDVVFFMNRIHVRHGYVWHHPVHECQKWVGEGPEKIVNEDRIELHHFQNRQTSRAQYLPLLEMSVREDPADDRNCHYLGREYYYARRYDEAINELTRHLSLPRAQWVPERASSMSYIAQSYEFLGKRPEAESWYLKACAEYDDRDHWVRLAMFYLRQKFHAGAYMAALRALRHTTRPLTYMSDASSWGALPHDIAATAAFYLGLQDACLKHYAAAVDLAPDDKRLRGDFEFCQKTFHRKAG